MIWLLILICILFISIVFLIWYMYNENRKDNEDVETRLLQLEKRVEKYRKEKRK